MGEIGIWNGPSGGGVGGNATADKIVAPYSAFVDGEEIIGVLTDHGNVIFIPTSSDQSIPDGAYKGAIIKAASGGTATAADILIGKTATVDSGLTTGVMVNQANRSFTPSANAQTIPKGFYDGTGTVGAIPSGTYYKMAYGSLTLSSGAGTVSGLAGRPTYVILLFAAQLADRAEAAAQGSTSLSNFVYFIVSTSNAGAGGNFTYNGTLTINSNGFSVSGGLPGSRITTMYYVALLPP